MLWSMRFGRFIYRRTGAAVGDSANVPRLVIPVVQLVIPPVQLVIPTVQFVIPDLIRDPVPHHHWIAGQARNDKDGRND